MNRMQILQYWQIYLRTLPEDRQTHQPFLVDQFGDTAELADELGQRILEGIKTATSSALWEWKVEKNPLPCIGLKTIVLNGANHPICVIETTEIKICPFNQVDAQFAYEEGEGDRSLEFWRREHWTHFSRVLPKIGKAPTSEMPLVCERFRVVY
ncbi:MAG: ASCH domain-containing protein [Leptolyngbyaceae cyanobacterium]